MSNLSRAEDGPMCIIVRITTTSGETHWSTYVKNRLSGGGALVPTYLLGDLGFEAHVLQQGQYMVLR